MALIEKTFKGKDPSHLESHYTHRRFLYFWSVSGLEGKVKSGSCNIGRRQGSGWGSGTKTFRLLIFSSSYNKPNHADIKPYWSNRNDNTCYQYNSTYGNDERGYFWYSRRNKFGNVLVDIPISITGVEAGKEWTSYLSFDVPADKQDASLWNGKYIYAGITSENDTWPYDLLWPMNIKCNLKLNYQNSPELKYYTNSEWKEVNGIYRYTGGEWKEVSEMAIYKDSSWKTN